MMRGKLLVAVGLGVALAAGAPAERVQAQEAAQEEGESRFGIGFQSSWPAYGISGLIDLNDRITLQAIVGAFGTVSNFGGRAMYRFTTEDKYDLYGFGTAGVWRYDYVIATENSVGAGGGVGIELDWRRILTPDDNSFPRLFSSIDIGFVLANFDHYNFSGFSIGGGLHYRF